jgi:SPP1 gp7 family putative phage head morphogenesis protein
LINQAIIQNDVFGLKSRQIGDGAAKVMMDAAAPPERAFEFSRSSDKVTQFMAWLTQQQDNLILGVTHGVDIASSSDSAWTNLYIELAYTSGLSGAASKMRKEGASVASSWVNTAFQRPIHADRVGLAYTRTFSELDGITKTMDQQISRVLAQGIAEGRGPFDIARQINERVDKIGRTRSRMLARTEVINAHADASLNAYQEAGLEGVEVEAEWLTAADPCPKCEEAARGGPYTISVARGLIPLHPNCRCAWAPKVVNGTGIELI